jgi:hypothetical protein
VGAPSQPDALYASPQPPWDQDQSPSWILTSHPGDPDSLSLQHSLFAVTGGPETAWAPL